MSNDSPMEFKGDINLSSIRQWLEQLPEANLPAMARQLGRLLVVLPNSGLMISDQLLALELISPKLNLALTASQNVLIHAALPHDDNQLRHRAFVTQNAHQLFERYRQLAVNWPPEESRQALALILQRAMIWLFQGVYYRLLAYLEIDTETWINAHQLYQHAHTAGVQDLEFLHPCHSAQISTSMAYRMLLLLVAANPWQLRPSAMKMLVNELPAWSRQALLLPSSENNRNLGQFFIGSRHGKAPVALKLSSSPQQPEDEIMDTRQLVQALTQSYKRASGSHQFWQFSALIRHLLFSWLTPRRRHFLRHCLGRDIQLILGLSGIHALLSCSADDPWAQMEARTRQDHSPASDSLSLDAVYPPLTHSRELPLTEASEAATEHELNTRISIWEEESPMTTMYRPYTFTGHDESAGGFCLRWDQSHQEKQHAPKLRVGELLAVEVNEDLKGIGIAVIQWLRQLKDEDLRLGLRLMSPSAEPVMIQLVSKQHPSRTNRHHGLLLPEIALLNITMRILTPPLIYRTHQRLELVPARGVARHIVLTRELESTGAFAQFEYLETKELDLLATPHH